MQNRKITGSLILDSRTSISDFLTHNNAFFNNTLNNAHKSNFTPLRQNQLFTLEDNMFYFHARKFNSDQAQLVQQFLVVEIQHFLNNRKGTFAVTYIHSSFLDFIAFRKMLQRWPRHFVQRLRRIYIVEVSFMVKLIQTFTFGTFGRMCDDLFVNLDAQSEVEAHDRSLLESLGEQGLTEQQRESYADSVRVIKNGLYGKSVGQQQPYDGKYPLLLHNGKYPLLLHNGKYPLLLLRLLSRILQQQSDLQRQGIFRKNCDAQQLEKLQQQLISNHPQAIRQEQDVFVVCGCLKKWLNNLSIPIFSYHLYNRIILFPGGDQVVFCRELLADMDGLSHVVFVLLVVFMSECVISRQGMNKMTSYNMAVVFAPCFLRPKQYDLKDLLYSGKLAKVLITCFENVKQLVSVEDREGALDMLDWLRTGKILE